MNNLLRAKCRLYLALLDAVAASLPEDGSAPDIRPCDLDLMELLMRDPDVQAHLEKGRKSDARYPG